MNINYLHRSLLLHYLLLLALVALSSNSDGTDMLYVPARLQLRPLPPSCHLVDSTSTMYTHGTCPLTPCHTTTTSDGGGGGDGGDGDGGDGDGGDGGGKDCHGHSCCLSDWKRDNLTVICSGGTRITISTVRVCRCQLCDSIHSSVHGEVLSSKGGTPVVLAAVMWNGEVVALADTNGKFAVELAFPKDLSKITLMIQEARHRPMLVKVPFSLSVVKLHVLMEHIEQAKEVDSLSNPLTLSFPASNSDSMAVQFKIQPSSFVVDRSRTGIPVQAPGCIISSLFSGLSELISPALSNVMYRDSKGQKFRIFSFASGSLVALTTEGKELELARGQKISITLFITMSLMDSKDVEKLHLFVYSNGDKKWIDRGRIKLINSSMPLRGVLYSTSMEGVATVVPSLWSIAVPIQATCYIRVRVVGASSSQRGRTIAMSQSTDILGSPVMYQLQLPVPMHSTDFVVCVEVVCKLGGTVRVIDNDSHVEYRPHKPYIKYGLHYDDHLMFYCNNRAYITLTGDTPYYPTLSSCTDSIITANGQFVFASTQEQDEPHSPSLPEGPTYHIVPHPLHNHKCYIKVGLLLGCAAITEVSLRVVSNNRFDRGYRTWGTVHQELGCGSRDGMLSQLATCMHYSCGHRLVVSAYSILGGNTTSWCRPWAFSPGLSEFLHTTHFNSFVLKDDGSLYNKGVGLYSSPVGTLAHLKCRSGVPNRLSSTLDHTLGIAVTFICHDHAQ